MCLGAALVLAALFLFGWNQHEAAQAAESGKNALEKLTEKLEERKDQLQKGEVPLPDPYDGEMTVVEIDGYGYVGYLSLPALGLELPVMETWSYPQLQIAPCRYTGSTKTGDLVIAAHNYEEHFGTIKNSQPGDPVYFTDMDGVVTAYEVEEVSVLQPTAVADMTSGEYELTLFTCTYGGQSRVTVRCRKI